MIDFDALTSAAVAGAFGETVLYAPYAAAALAVVGVFEASYLPVLPLGDVGNDIGMPAPVTERRPVLGVRLNQFPVEPLQGDRVTIRGTLYVVREVQPDGQGWATLLLNVSV